MKLELLRTYHTTPCPHHCQDSGDFKGEEKKNIHWEPGGNLKRPREITWGGTAVPASWGMRTGSCSWNGGSLWCCQVPPCCLCCWAASRAIFESLLGAPLQRRVLPWVSHCAPSQATSLGYGRCDLWAGMSWLLWRVTVFWMLGTHCFLYYRISLKMNKHHTVFISRIWAAAIENITNGQKDDIWKHTME